MNCVLISIGDELLIGQTINTNAAWLGEQLNLLGYKVIAGLVIPDDKVCLLYTSPSPRDREKSRMPSSA